MKKKAPSKKRAGTSAGRLRVERIGLRARPGSRVNEEAVRDVGGTIVKLLQKKKCSAENLLAEASKPSNPAHKHFEWDDAKAAHQHRLDQARRFIVSIEIVTSDVSIGAVRLCWPAGKGAYVSFDEMKSDFDLLKVTIEDAKRDLEAFERKYSMLSGLPEAKALFAEFAKKMAG